MVIRTPDIIDGAIGEKERKRPFIIDSKYEEIRLEFSKLEELNTSTCDITFENSLRRDTGAMNSPCLRIHQYKVGFFEIDHDV